MGNHLRNNLRIGVCGIFVASMLVFVGASAGSARAAVTPLAYYRLGEDDPALVGPGPSNLGANPTLDHTANHYDLTRKGVPQNSIDVAPGAAANTGSTMSMQFASKTLDSYY